MIVLDASVVIDILLQRPDAPGIERQIFHKEKHFFRPDLLDVEVLSAFRRLYLFKELSVDQ